MGYFLLPQTLASCSGEHQVGREGKGIKNGSGAFIIEFYISFLHSFPYSLPVTL